MTTTQRAELLKLIASGASYRRAAAVVGVCHTTARDHAIKAGIARALGRSGKRYTAKVRRDAVEAVRAGRSMRSVAKAIGCKDITVAAWVRQGR